MQKIIQFALKSRLLVLVLGVLVVAAGWWTYQRLPIDAFPDVSPSLVQVFTVTEGLAPAEVERYVTYPVETAMNGLPAVEQVRSVSNFGLSVVSVYFEEGTDIYFARQLVGERLQEARESIPPGFGEPEMGPISTGMGLVLFYYLDDTTGAVQPRGAAHDAGLDREDRTSRPCPASPRCSASAATRSSSRSSSSRRRCSATT